MEVMKKKLPIVISVPHGGLMIPTNLIKKCLLTPEEVLLDCDTWSHEIYDFDGMVEEFVDTPIARIVVDMNRDLHDLPPQNPDGVVKTLSVVQKPVWNTEDGGLSEAEIEVLLEDYYSNYHQQLEASANNPNVVLGIDCHTMLDVGPVAIGANWEKRPLFCLGNRGSETGHSIGEPITAPVETLEKLKALLEEKFSDYKDEAEGMPLVTLNQPFAGGYITRHHGNKGNIPWIQLEINRCMYLPKPSEKLKVIPPKETQIKLKKFRDDLYEVFKELVEE
ncbi:N-formylglutamate amidohydrolase [Alkalihalobacterium chitinilyticum]|uniref:N-formylglutamate amidohydrolase n=1 Tax=Alkalihalobacterium chitinilyticum TaxID=2980103 RepID=A0ABT5VI06_9BACI|nr:N-formylglutamate amidohydrolase [Alkalihalobacterium chitinilyticum]MDE5415087.1 N-formylglutamate amidohydrolase [Alkalihalobacterium chitinilyticum]